MILETALVDVRIQEEQRKWAFLKAAPIEDAQTPEIRGLAAPLLLVAAASPWRQWAFAQLAMCVARDLILYKLDGQRVGREQIDGFTDPQGPRDAPLRRGVDDCDAKARLFVAICLAGGLEAEMWPRWKGWQLAHVYGRVWLAGPHDRQSRWHYAETILRRARLGEVSDTVPKELETGKWLF